MFKTSEMTEEQQQHMLQKMMEDDQGEEEEQEEEEEEDFGRILMDGEEIKREAAEVRAKSRRGADGENLAPLDEEMVAVGPDFDGGDRGRERTRKADLRGTAVELGEWEAEGREIIKRGSGEDGITEPDAEAEVGDESGSDEEVDEEKQRRRAARQKRREERELKARSKGGNMSYRQQVLEEERRHREVRGSLS